MCTVGWGSSWIVQVSHIGSLLESQSCVPVSFARRSGWLPLRLTEESYFGWPGIVNIAKSLFCYIVSQLREFAAVTPVGACKQKLSRVNLTDAREKAELNISSISLNFVSFRDMEMFSEKEEFNCATEPGDSNTFGVHKELPSADSVWCLPDEIISSLLGHLDAKDLISLEFVSKRFRDIVRSESGQWRSIVQRRWSSSANAEILETASLLAGGWKRLYMEKHLSEIRRAPWIVPSKSELEAMLEIIKSDCSLFPHGSPVGVYQTNDMHIFSNQACVANHDKLATTIYMDDSPTSAISDSSFPPLCIAILIDGSSSVTEEDFIAMKEFCRALLASLRLTHPSSQACIIQFNQYPRVEVGLADVSKPGIMDTVERLEQMMGSTDIAAPIHGQTHAEEFELSILEARKAFDELNAAFYAFGVGRDVDEQGLQRIVYASRRSSSYSKGGYFTLRKLRK
ncbi:hypothetical protein Gasu2_68620 [Galdieria sulphuraria]|nr:hypothetical protein Gasu2_68620 [Galdieria sulphuraria]